jgi:signal transduction histidine kinase
MTLSLMAPDSHSHTMACLQEANRRKDEFIATLGHELRDPLFTMRNGLEIARPIAACDERLRLTLAMMERQLAHMVRLVEDLMDVSRIGYGKVELQRHRLCLRDVVTAGIESCGSAVTSRRHEIRVECVDEVLHVEGDGRRLTQVFTNLVSNSAKYTEPGGRIRVRVEREGSWAAVRVIDNGIGIPPEELAEVFDLFAQVPAHNARSDGGLGIGLSLVRSLVQLHGGSVTAQSDGAGTGCTFTVRLPLAA